MPIRGPSRLRSNEFAKPFRGPLDRPEFDDFGHPAAEDVLSEIGLVLVIVLGVILAINTVLVALHVSP